MRFRAIAVAVLAVAGLTACGSSGGSSSTSGSAAPAQSAASAAQTAAGNAATSAAVPAATAAPTSAAGSAGAGANIAGSAFCTKLAGASAQLSGLESKVNDPSSLKDALGKVATYLQGLDSGAPAAAKPAIDDLLAGVKSAQSALSGSGQPDASALQDLSTKMATDVTSLGEYIAQNCTSN